MIDVVAIHTEPSGSKHLEHITKLRWIETSKAGQHGVGTTHWSSRSQMYEFVKNNRYKAYAISRNDNTYAFLETVDNGHTKYVKTEPDSTKCDNLLSLDRF